MIRDRADVGFAASALECARLFASPKYPLRKLGELCALVQYGCSALSSAEPKGWPIIRMNNLQQEGWDFSDLKYYAPSEEEAASYRVERGDILFNRTNGSRDLVGKCEVFDEPGDWLFASYLIRIRVNRSMVRPQFISQFLNTKAGRALILRSSRQILMSNINAQEIRALEIPLPSLKIQEELEAKLAVAKADRDRKLTEAAALLTSLDGWLLEQLRLTPPPADPRRMFAVKLGAVRGRRLDASAYQPLYQAGVNLQTPIRKLRDAASVDVNTAAPPEEDSQLVPYVGLPECDQTEIREVALRPYSEVKGRSIVRPGDILFARIEPSVFNQKYVLAENLKGHDYAYTSTEFYVVRAKPGVEQAYLYAMMFCSFVFAQVRGKTTGSSGRRRIDRDLFSELQIPMPPAAKQKAIAAEVVRRRETARRLRAEAATDWAATKAWFAEQLLGSSEAGKRNP